MIERDARSASEKVRLFRLRFAGLTQAYGTYDLATGKSWQVKQPVTDAVILRHLTGKRPYGVYLLDGEKTRAVVADFDSMDPEPPSRFVARARHYGMEAYIERSKSKGFHVYFFFGPAGVNAAKARAVAKHILGEIESPHTELFPKQDVLDPGSGNYGNFLNAPLFGRLVPEGKAVFVQPISITPYPNQWVFLENVRCVCEAQLDEAIELNGLAVGQAATAPRSLGVFEQAWALPPCARRMLEGVQENQRVACFRLACHLRRIGLPLDMALAVLMHWRSKNQPGPGKCVISENEVKAQAGYAYTKEYRGYGCEDPIVAAYCEDACPVRSSRNGGSRASVGEANGNAGAGQGG